MSRGNDIRWKAGLPVLSDFSSADGTPIVINVLSGIAYYAYKNVVYPIKGGTSVQGAFSDGFSEEFS